MIALSPRESESGGLEDQMPNAGTLDSRFRTGLPGEILGDQGTEIAF
jgi:hypothetical protein